MMASPPELEFFYDCSSPWTYFAFARVIPLMEELELPIRWRPILVGGVFNAANQRIYAAREGMFADEQRLTHYFKDMQNWSEFIGIKVDQPDIFPVNSVKGMRGTFFAEEQGVIVEYSQALFKAYWGDNRDISDDKVLQTIAESVGLNPTAYFAAITSPGYKDKLRSNTDELVSRGGYGSPTMFINGDQMYFGNDRLPLVEHRLKQLLSR
ncbi:MAG: 2-hydroxychromene-2-carboxylate isomerase [Halioglobus sp.]|jgi:2-hydroxychromene-2-carboxylate isomerase